MPGRSARARIEPYYPRVAGQSAEVFELRADRDDDPAEVTHRARPQRRSVAARVARSVLTFAIVALVAVGSYLAGEMNLLDRAVSLTSGNVQDAATAEATPSLPAPPPPSQENAGLVREEAAPAALPRAPAVPEPAILAMIARNAIIGLHQANVTGNYSVFRESAAPGFQEANSPAQLGEIFADLRQQDLPLDWVAVAAPNLYRRPGFDEAGRLWLTGFFPMGETIADFEIAFERTGQRWRVFGMGIEPRPATEEELAGLTQPIPGEVASGVVPDPATLVVLIRSSIAALNQANLTGNYSVLRDLTAPGFQEANSFARLTELFGALRERGIDIGPTAIIDPRLFRPAEIDSNGMLRLTGFFPSQPEQVNFDLAFQYVGGVWKIFGIGVNTTMQAAAAEAIADPAPASADSAAALNEAPANDRTAMAKPVSAVPPVPRIRPDVMHRRRPRRGVRIHKRSGIGRSRELVVAYRDAESEGSRQCRDPSHTRTNNRQPQMG